MILFILMMISCGNSLQTEAGVKVRISNSGLTFCANVGLDIFSEKITTVAIQDILEIKPLMSYGVTNIKITSFTKPTTRIVPIAGQGLSVFFDKAAIQLSFNWKYTLGKAWLSVKHSGSGLVKTKSMSINAVVKIGRDGNGKPTISAGSCSCSITGFDIQINGGILSSIYNLIINAFEAKIKNKIQSAVCDNIRTVINKDGNNTLSTLKTIINIDNQISLDYRLTGDPIYTKEYLETSHSGEFFSNSGLKYDKITSPLNFVLDNKHMVNMAITERFLNSYLYIYYRQGRLEYRIPMNDLKDLIQIFKDSELVVEIKASEAPFIKINSSSYIINIATNIEVRNTLTGQTVLKFNVSFSIDLRVYFESARIKGAINDISWQIQFTDWTSSYKYHVLRLVKGLLGRAMTSLNDFGAAGFPVPSLDPLNLVNSTVKGYDGYALIMSDFQRR